MGTHDSKLTKGGSGYHRCLTSAGRGSGCWGWSKTGGSGKVEKGR